MRALLDTCVVSELQRPRGAARVRKRVQALPEDELYLSVITLGELTKGVASLAKGKRKDALRVWLAALEREHSSRILPIDVECARIWGELTAAAKARGTPVGACDGLIAATALCHGLAVWTRNIADFTPTGAPLVDPWEGE